MIGICVDDSEPLKRKVPGMDVSQLHLTHYDALKGENTRKEMARENQMWWLESRYEKP